jgi:hypothetical protein
MSSLPCDLDSSVTLPSMRRAWTWYRRTLGESWAKMSPSKRCRFVVIMVVSLAIPAAVVVAVALAPHARGPIIVGFVVVWLLAHWSLTIVSARRRKRR